MVRDQLTPLRVLFIDDSSDDVFFILKELKLGGYAVANHRVDSATGLQYALQNEAWDLIITDYFMPGFSAEEALAIYNKHSLDVPVILMSGAVGEAAAIAIMKAGVHDFVMKDNMARLIPVIQRELEEASVRTARRKAEQANVAKSLFLANMSHEIRTPMSGVIGMAALLAETTLSHEQREYVTAIQSSGDALMGIVNDILDISKIEAGKLELDPVVFNLRELVAETIDVLNIKSLNKEVPLFYYIDHGIPSMLVGDPIRIRQILMNLLSNAIKFTSAGYVMLKVQLGRCEVGQVSLEFVISDTGIGIAESKLKEVFDDYIQADRSTAREYGGTGLGLSICKRLAHLMSGEVTLESVEGEGATFRFNVDLEVASARAGQLRSTMAGADGASELAMYRILLCHQGTPSGAILEKLLRNRVSGVEAVPSLAQLSEKLRDTSDSPAYDLLCFEDLTLTSQIKSLLEFAQCQGKTRLLYVAPYSNRGDISYCERQLCHGYLNHPLHDAALDTVLSGLFDQESSGAYKLVTRFESAHGKNAFSRDKQGIGVHVLLVEDNQVNQKIALHMLQRLGCEVLCVNNGAEAVQACEVQNFDIILMDCEMPVMNGYEATIAIKKRNVERGVHTQIIALTASAMESDRHHCLESGMDGFLMKPIDKEALEMVLQAHQESVGLRQSAG